MLPSESEGSLSTNHWSENPGAGQALYGSYGGFQPKPAVEVVIVAMKPLTEKTFVDQALKNGKGVTWLDDCRVPIAEGEVVPDTISSRTAMGQNSGWNDHNNRPVQYTNDGSRFTANLLVSDDALDHHSRYFSLDAWVQDLAAVVDEDNRLLGIVTVDDVIDVLIEEQTEDVLHMGGVSVTEEAVEQGYFATKPWRNVRSRFNWLLLLFVAETFALNHNAC
jgi:CBS domain-containing protein